MKKYSVIIIGAGGRGTDYARYMKMMLEKFQVVGVADAIKERRENIKNMFGLKENECYKSWVDILSKPKMADIAVIATMDNVHYEPAMKAIELGYNLLLEKPVAQTAQECIDIARYPYYRIYVKNYVIYYVVIDDDGQNKIMEVRRFLYNRQNFALVI